MSLNLDEVKDKDGVILELATALAWYMDGEKDHDIQANTGFEEKDCQRIADARKLAKSIIGWN